MDFGVTVIVPICICVILPIAIVWIACACINNRTNRQSEIVMEALKCNPNVDTEKLLAILRKREYTPWENLTRKLLRGCIFTLTGIAFALIAIFFPEEGETFGCWVACGILGAVGIGFLITYWFSYVNIEKFTAEREEIHKK